MTGRWTPQQKRKLLWLYGDGEIDLAWLEHQGISAEEFAHWISRYETYGLAGLALGRKPELSIRVKRAYIEMVYGGLYGLRLRHANEAECDRLIRAIADYKRAEGVQ